MPWDLTEADLEPIAMGAAVLGTGGGGNPYLGWLRARLLSRQGTTIRVVDPDEVSDDAFVCAAGGMGAPVVTHEKLPRGDEETQAVRALENHLGRRFDVIAPLEMGGQNSMVALVVGGLLGIPVLDGDGMGRAFPELQMVTYLIYGGQWWPAALADESDCRIVVEHVPSPRALERVARAITIEFGGHAGLAMCVMNGQHAERPASPARSPWHGRSARPSKSRGPAATIPSMRSRRSPGVERSSAVKSSTSSGAPKVALCGEQPHSKTQSGGGETAIGRIPEREPDRATRWRNGRGRTRSDHTRRLRQWRADHD